MTIENIVNELLSKIPYSKKYQKVRSKIQTSLEEKYNEYIKENDNLTSITKILEKYGTIEASGLLAGYKLEEIKSWKQDENITDYKTFKTTFKKEKRKIIAFSISTVLTISYIITALVYFSPFNLIFASIPFLISLLLLIDIRKYEKKNYNYSFETYDEIQNIEDKYHKKTINSILLGISLLSLTVSIILSTNFRLTEILSRIMSNIIVFEIILVCILKNIIINHNLKQKIESIYQSKYKSQITKVSILSFIYWFISAIVTFLIFSKYKLISLLVFTGIFYIIYLFYIFKIRKSIVRKNITLNKKRILLLTLLIFAFAFYQIMKLDSWILQPFINAIKTVEIDKDYIEYNDETGVYTITTDKDEFKILQLTDIHLGGSFFSSNTDARSLITVYNLIEYTKPDLVIVTGDLVFPLGVMSLSFNNSAPLIQFTSFMRNIGIPWAFAYGNHDTESLAILTEKEVDELFTAFSFKTSKNLLYPYTQPNITGRNNQLIEVRKENGEILQALFILDSNSYYEDIMNNYDYIHDDQVKWYEEKVLELSKQEGKTIPSMLFFHMPLNEYQTAYDLYKQKSEEVTYHYGVVGEENEAICDSKYHSKLFETAVSLGSTKAMFCGHDHLNNVSLTYKGVRLTYGLSIDYLAYPGIDKLDDQRGGTLITIYNDSSFDITPIKLKDI